MAMVAPIAGQILAKPLVDLARKTDVGKKIEKGIVGTAKKVGKFFKKAFHFQEGGKVRRPPVAYKRGGRVKGRKRR